MHEEDWRLGRRGVRRPGLRRGSRRGAGLASVSVRGHRAGGRQGGEHRLRQPAGRDRAAPRQDRGAGRHGRDPRYHRPVRRLPLRRADLFAGRREPRLRRHRPQGRNGDAGRGGGEQGAHPCNPQGRGGHAPLVAGRQDHRPPSRRRRAQGGGRDASRQAADRRDRRRRGRAAHRRGRRIRRRPSLRLPRRYVDLRIRLDAGRQGLRRHRRKGERGQQLVGGEACRRRSRQRRDPRDRRAGLSDELSPRVAARPWPSSAG